eukprot:1586248-Amphidinium_carterae.1
MCHLTVWPCELGCNRAFQHTQVARKAGELRDPSNYVSATIAKGYQPTSGDGASEDKDRSPDTYQIHRVA